MTIPLRITNIAFLRMFNAAKLIDFIYQFTATYQKEQKALKVLHNFTNSVISSRRKGLLENNGKQNLRRDDHGTKKKTALLDLLLQSKINGKALTNKDIREEVDTFMFEVI